MFSDYQFTPDKYKQELFYMFQSHLEPIFSSDYLFQNVGLTYNEKMAVRQLANAEGKAISILPEVIFMRLHTLEAEEQFYTLIHNSGYSNVTSLLNENKNRLPNEDDLTIVPGFIGSYPNVFWDIQSTDLDDLIKRIEALSSESDYQQLLDIYGVRRTSKQFWAMSDHAHIYFKQTDSIKAGLFDYNRLENR